MQVQFIIVYLGLLCKFDCSFGVPSWCTSAFERGLKKVDFCTKKAHFLPKSAMTGVWESPVQSWKHKEVIFHVSSHGDAKSFGGFLQKLDFWPKNGILDPKKIHFGHFGPKKGLPSGQMGIHLNYEYVKSCFGMCLQYVNTGMNAVGQKKVCYMAVA